MQSLDELRKILRDHLPELRNRYHVEEIALFGSYARGEQTPESDVDILVTLSAPLGLEFVDLHDYLAKLVGSDVDVLTRDAIDRKPLLRYFIEEDLVSV